MKLHPEVKPLKSQLPWRMFFTVPGRVTRTKGSVAEKARKGDRKPPRKRDVTAKAVWDTSSNWLEGPPLLWLQEKHLPHASSRQLLTWQWFAFVDTWVRRGSSGLDGSEGIAAIATSTSPPPWKQEGVGPSAPTLVPMGRKDLLLLLELPLLQKHLLTPLLPLTVSFTWNPSRGTWATMVDTPHLGSFAQRAAFLAGPSFSQLASEYPV